MLDLEYTIDKQAAWDAIKRLAQYARYDFGLKLDSRSGVFWNEFISDLPEKLNTVILTNTNEHLLKKQVKLFHHKELSILVEAICLEEAQIAEQCGVDGIIAKGHEAGGRVGEETSFVLLQRFLANLRLPVWAHGGIGRHTAAACYAAGAAGIALDSQLALCQESPIPESIKVKLATLDGSETFCIGDDIGETYRVYARPGLPIVEELLHEEKSLNQKNYSRIKKAELWRQAIIRLVGWESMDDNLLFLGQDIAFAAAMASRYGTVGGVLQGIKEEIDTHCQAARKLQPLDEESPLARSHGTRYPIVQGPMARISDTPTFALEVARKGGLPFLALSLMEPSELKGFLQEAGHVLGDYPWGVGIIGFLPPELLHQQMNIICECRPPYALIAGGLPNQNKPLVDAGVITYMHIPSPGLLNMFLKNGDRRFIFEGQESGGHVGPFTSFSLWERMIDELLKYLTPEKDASEYHVLFAGGIHDDLSASMVAVMAAPLAERGVRIGVQMGTAYLFTEELVTLGGISEVYQEEVLQCDHTIVLEVGPGHANRCIPTPFAIAFEEEKLRLKAADKPAEEIRFELDKMSIGRLRLASKGVSLDANGELHTLESAALGKDEQRANGMFMIGEVGAIRNKVSNIEALHYNVAVEGSWRLKDIAGEYRETVSLGKKRMASDIAIIGMACIMPEAPDLPTFWQNILNKVEAIKEIPRERWDWRLYYDENPKAKDKVYSKWGAFLDDVIFDPLEYGMAPNTLSSIEPLQLLTLEVVKRALEDAGYDKRPFNRQQTSVIIGTGGGAGDLGQLYGVRSALPMFFGEQSEELVSHFGKVLPEWTEDSFAGILMNVVAGRVANRFDLGGANFTVDAACASSLAALYLAVNELESGTSDMVIVGGADTLQNPFTYLCFSKTMAVSPTGKARVFDETADGIVLGEGIGAVLLKRLADAERDGDRIYAIIKSVGSASDGRAKALTAPRLEGQVLAMNRAYQKANISPVTVGLIEAHGTGTVVGDRVEIQALGKVFSNAHASQPSCAIGSVKSMVGHTKTAAGVAGLIKATLALYHKILPPTLGISKPNIELDLLESPFYAISETRPWINSASEYPRRAGVSGFGFGGTNFHLVLEEYNGDYLRRQIKPELPFQQIPGEVLIFSGNSIKKIIEAIEPLEKALSQGASPELADLAFTLNTLDEQKTHSIEQTDSEHYLKLAIIAESLDDLRAKLTLARETLAAPDSKRSDMYLEINDPRGMYFTEQPLAKEGKLAFLFPGQGSQYINMLNDLAIQFPEVHASFERAALTLKHQLDRPLSSYIFPPPVFDEDMENVLKQALTQTNIAQPAVGAADMAMFHLLRELGLQPDFVAGHSYGEYVALCAAGVFSEDVLIALSEARGRFIVEAAGAEPGSMAAINADSEVVAEVLEDVEGVQIANLNAPGQTIISGETSAVQTAVGQFQAKDLKAMFIPVACAFHSPIVAGARQRLAEFLANIELSEPQLVVYSNTIAGPYPVQPEAITSLLVKHLVSPVNFVQEITAMHDAGARIFVEVGPRSVLTPIVDQVLQDKPHLTVNSDRSDAQGLLQLHRLLGQLAVNGVPVKWSRLYRGRKVRQLDLNTLDKEGLKNAPTSTAWLVNGGRAIPVADADNIRSVNVEPVSLSKFVSKPVSPGVSSAPLFTQPPLSAVEPERHSMQPAVESNLPDGHARVMAQFQQMMNRFLDTQKSVMQTYLKARAGALTIFDTGQEPASTVSQEAEVEAPSVKQAQATAKIVKDEMPAYAPAESMGEAEIRYDKDELTSYLLNVVSERTGYPPEMLDLDLDLEADLGIDSIKRIEILGNLQEKYPWMDESNMDEFTEKLSRLKTLRNIIDSLSDRQKLIEIEEEIGSTVRTSDSGVETSSIIEDDVADGAVIQRFTLAAIDTPVGEQPGVLASNRTVIITDDENGIASTLAEQLRDRGHPVALVRMGEALGTDNSDYYTANLASLEAIDQLLTLIRKRLGPVGGLVHLLPLKDGVGLEEMDLKSWKERLQLDVKSLFYMAKSLHQDLDNAARDSRAFLVAATKMGGTFASVSPEATTLETGQFLPSHGGVSGLLKTISVEWPKVNVRVVDTSLLESSADLVAKLLRAIVADDGQVEVGYMDSRRLVLQPVPTPVDKEKPASLEMDSSWVILLTGGTQGITADVGIELAKRYQPTLLLVGRSPLPEFEELKETVGLTDQKLKSALVTIFQRQNQSVTPPQVEAAYKRLLKDREMRRNISAMRSYGANVEYFQVDVREEIEFGEVIDKIYQTYGRLDGVIHGAGVIEDKLVRDKSIESFDRVFNTKAESAFILSKKLRPDSLKFLVFFSSVAGRFGNQGQCDYSAANEVYNKLAIYLDNHWPGRVVSIMWGPWARSGGMVSSELEKQFARSGVVLVPPSVGIQKLDEEIRYGRKGESEVIISGNQTLGSRDGIVQMLGQAKQEVNEKPSPLSLPLLGDRASSVQAAANSVEIEYCLDLSRDLYLKDHQLDGKPVLPMAIALEFMAEAVSSGWPELKLNTINDMHVLQGIVIENDLKPIRVIARQGDESSQRLLNVNVYITDTEEKGRTHYRAGIELAEQAPAPVYPESFSLAEVEPFPLTVQETYRQWLFHGPLFQRITRIDGISPNGIAASMISSSPRECIAGITQNQWLIDPMIIDSGLQLLLIWVKHYWDMMVLPSRFSVFRNFGFISSSEIKCHLNIHPDSKKPLVHCDLAFYSADGNLLGLMENFEGTCSRSLNRVAGSNLQQGVI